MEVAILQNQIVIMKVLSLQTNSHTIRKMLEEQIKLTEARIRALS